MSTKANALRRLPAVRERCRAVYKLAQAGKVDAFKLDESKYDDIVELCARTISVSSQLGFSLARSYTHTLSATMDQTTRR